ncbi:MAG: HAMP domain-containing protein [Spirulinaceae cyanobacterium SM2_1_0]|nr:HAMP domain-containing protein [Spirulinaceae cyanobacterium SM2_1_0]
MTLFIGLLITRWLTQPLIRLSANAQAIAKGDWDKTIELDRGDAIGDLSRSFSAMADQLKASFTQLEQRIEERTLELVQLNQELEKLAHTDALTQVANRRYFDHYLGLAEKS